LNFLGEKVFFFSRDKSRDADRQLNKFSNPVLTENLFISMSRILHTQKVVFFC